MRYIVALLALALLTLASPAHAGTGTVRLKAPTHSVAHVKVKSVTPVRGAVRVRFNTGSKWRVVPCKHEDSNNCYWNARKRGNGIGTSFVTLKGKTYAIRS